MTRDEAKEAAMVMLAYANGEQVQVQLSDGSWIDFPINPIFDWQHVNYRIKPKPEPKYRPFKTQEECWEEMLKHNPFGWIKSKATDRLYNISSIYKDKGFYKIAIEDFILTLSDLFDSFVFIDRTPFGIKEE